MATIYPLPLDAATIQKIINGGGAVVVSHGNDSVAAYPIGGGGRYAPEIKATVVRSDGFKPVSIAAAAGRLAASRLLGVSSVQEELQKITAEIQKILALDFSERFPDRVGLDKNYTGAALAESMENVLCGKWSEVKLAGLALAWRVFVLGDADADFMSESPQPGGMTEIEARGYLIKEHFGAVSVLVGNALFLDIDGLKYMHQVRIAVAEHFAVGRKTYHLLTDAHVRSACDVATKIFKKTFSDSPVFNVSEEALLSDIFSVYTMPRYIQDDKSLKPVFVHVVDHMLRQIIELDPLVLASVPPPSNGDWPLLQFPLSPCGKMEQGRLMFPSVNESAAFQEFSKLASAALRAHLEKKQVDNARAAHIFTGVLHVSGTEHYLSDLDPKFQGRWFTAIVNLSDAAMGASLDKDGLFFQPGRILTFERPFSSKVMVRPAKKQVYLVVNMVVPADSIEVEKTKQIKSMLLHSGLASFGTEEKQQIYFPDFSAIVRNREALHDFILHVALLQRKDIISKFHTTLLVRWTSSSVSVEAYPGFSDQDRSSEEGATFAQVQKSLALKPSPKFPPSLSNAPDAGYAILRIYPADMPSIQNYLGLIADSPRITPKASILSK